MLVDICDFELTNRALNIGALQAIDRQRADSLEKLGLETGMSLYLGRLERTCAGDCYYHPDRYGTEDAGNHDIDGVDEDSIVLTDMTSLDGRYFASGIDIIMHD